MDVSLTSNRILTLSGTTAVDPFHTLALSGGVLNTGSLVVNGNFAFNSGTLGITGANGLTIGASGPFGSNFDLQAGRNLNVTNYVLVNSGSLFSLENGAGFNSGSVAISAGGELDLEGTTATATAGTVLNGGLIRGEGRLITTAGFVNSVAMNSGPKPANEFKSRAASTAISD